MGLNFLSLLALQLYMAHCLEGLTIQGQMYVSAQVPSLTQRTTLDKVPVQPVWNWSKVFAYKWSRPDHINSLELRSIVHSLEWRIRHLKECHVRVFQLTDSYVAMSVIAKGRSSARLLKPLLSRLAAALLAWDIQLIVSHVESSENPTDHDSRS